MDHVLRFNKRHGGWVYAHHDKVKGGVALAYYCYYYLLVFCPSFGSGISLFSGYFFGLGLVTALRRTKKAFLHMYYYMHI